MNNHTKTVVSTIPNCDLCPNVSDSGHLKNKAVYDAKTCYGPWAYVCKTHFVECGCLVGLGKGQKLVLREDLIKEKEVENG